MRSRISARTAGAVSVVVLAGSLVLGGGAASGMLAARATTTAPAAGVPGPAAVPGTTRVIGVPSVLRPADWHMIAIRHYGHPADASGYSAVVAPGRSGAWAFGGTNPGGNSVPVAERWIAGQWRSSPLPAHLTGFIGDASAPSSRDIWAVSYSSGYVLHWNGARWRVAKSWRQHGVLTGVTALSATNVWVFGTTTGGFRGLGTWHFNGRTWTRAQGRANEIYRASAVSGRDIWAVAANSHGGFVEHYDGRTWQRARTGRLLAGTRLDDVLAVSRRDVWVVGNLQTRHGDGRLLIAHFDGRHWKRAVTRWDGDIGRLAPDGSGGVWVSADNTGASSDVLIGHLPRHGRPTWRTLRHGLGSGVSDIAVSRGTHDVWLSGSFLTRAGGDAALWSRGPAPVTPAPVGRVTISPANVGLLIFRGWHQDLSGLLDLTGPISARRPSRDPVAE
jgi:hypothetical protein